MGPGVRDARPPAVLVRCGTSAMAPKRTFPPRRRRSGRGHAKSASHRNGVDRRTRTGLRARGYHSAAASPRPHGPGCKRASPSRDIQPRGRRRPPVSTGQFGDMQSDRSSTGERARRCAAARTGAPCCHEQHHVRPRRRRHRRLHRMPPRRPFTTVSRRDAAADSTPGLCLCRIGDVHRPPASTRSCVGRCHGPTCRPLPVAGGHSPAG